MHAEKVNADRNPRQNIFAQLPCLCLEFLLFVTSEAFDIARRRQRTVYEVEAELGNEAASVTSRKKIKYHYCFVPLVLTIFSTNTVRLGFCFRRGHLKSHRELRFWKIFTLP